MWIGRRLDGTIYGAWSVKQPDDADHPRQEEIADDDPELLACLNQAPAPRIVQDNAEAEDARNDSNVLALVNQTKAEWKTWAQTNFPSLTLGEQNRLGILFWVVAVAVRRMLR